MKYIFGLGNNYFTFRSTPHNVGHRFLKYLQYYPISTETRLSNNKGFINSSYRCLRRLIASKQINENTPILLVYDEKRLPLGQYRIRNKPSNTKHNGIINIQKYCSGNFTRLAIGVGDNKLLKSLNQEHLHKEKLIFEKIIKELKQEKWL